MQTTGAKTPEIEIRNKYSPKGELLKKYHEVGSIS
jgi:hypothetical protein